MRGLPRWWLRALVALVAVAALALAAVNLIGAGSSPTPHRSHAVESIFEDDQLLVLQPANAAGDREVDGAVRLLKLIGADRLRIIVEWAYLAPKSRPHGFDAADPGSYAACAWYPYDRVIRDARAAGLGVDLDLTGPAPAWAAGGEPAGVNPGVYEPSATDFTKFVQAVGRRYDGSYKPGASCPGTTVSDGGTLPRVNFWSVWNEPNQPGWLAPQWTRSGSGTAPGGASGGASGPGPSYAPAAPRIYRGLVDAYWQGLRRSGHTPGADTILVGELAPEGCVQGSSCVYARAQWPIPPITFVQDLYCVAADYRPLTGAAARADGCPASGSRAAFVAAHPALFRMTGFSHHPYSFQTAPAVSLPQPSFVPLADLSRLEHALDAIFSAYGVSGRLPLYLTEYGYVTNPPNPRYTVTPAEQAKYLDQAAYMAWADGRVRGLGQFGLQDPPPNTVYPPSSPKYWETFQEGLEYHDGKPKPALLSYLLPIWIQPPKGPADGPVRIAPGASVPVWGMLRAAANGTAQRAQIQWRGARGSYRTLATVTTRDRTGVLQRRVRPPASGTIRIAWRDPEGQVRYSRAVPVAVSGA